jgi:hypothetical protein
MEMSLLGQDAGDARQHAGLVGHHQAQVEGRDHLGRSAGSACPHQHAGLEGQVRHAVVGVGGVQPGDVHQVGDHGAGGGLAPAPLP